MKTPPRTRLIIAAGAAMIAAAPFAPVAPVALAHDAIVGGNPADGATVADFPAELQLDFSGQPDEGFNTMALSRVGDGGQSEVLYTGEPEVAGRTITLGLPADLDAQPGEYHVGFQIVSSDGHATKGMTTFTYEPAGGKAAEGEAATATASAESSSATPAAGESETGGTSSPWTLVLSVLGVLVVAGAGLGALAKYRRLRDVENRGEIPADRPETSLK